MLMVLLRKAVCHQLVEILCFIERERLFFKLVAQRFQLRDWWKSWTEAPAVVFGHQRSIFWAFPVTLPLSALRFTSINNDPPCVIISQVSSLSLSFFYLQQQPHNTSNKRAQYIKQKSNWRLLAILEVAH